MLASVLAALIFSASVSAQGTTCNATSPCPATAPCCSEFGFCGSGSTFCLGGCNPMASHGLDSCKPNPVCASATYTFQDNSRIVTNSSFYDGNSTAHDWDLDKGDIINSSDNGGELVLTLTQANGGTRLSSTHYVHYGKITTTLMAGKWNGVVAAFITMSDIKDEIDWEFPGDNPTEGQTNFFWQGFIPTPSVGQTTKNLTDNSANYHDYAVDWQPDTMTFYVDNNVVRTIKASDYNSNGISRYPSTPSRIQLSLWPAGVSSMPQGTIDWAGGMINWNDPDYVSAGHFYMRVKQVKVECADKPSANITSYVYGANSTTNTPTINLSNATTLLNGASMMAVPGISHLGLLSSVIAAALMLAHLV